ncbi:rhamnogalacturonan acetylesterase [Terrimonas alba]|uniref:rhamnogalacturonan acetylesterase n=1 Tax=Terrimonas alba TaxID=3349636 RepID=UPI0035F27EED
MNRYLFALLILSCFAFALPEKKKIKIFIAGDSTASIKETKTYPETGWGMPFVYFWDSSVTVVNRAKNGRSTKTFITEGLWQSIYDEAREGDYVLIQFGHNDEVPTKKSYTTEEEFRNNLAKYIKESKSKKAIPVLLTPVARRKFDSTGHIAGSHDVYSQIVRDVAGNEKVTLIDLDKKSQALYQQFGAEYSKLLFLQLKPGEHPNYPDGKDDNTHFNELGARLIAQLILKEIKEKLPDLAERVSVPVKK